MFSSLSTWVLSIAGVICLSVLIELILPNGQMNKYVKGIFAFIVVFVVISPVPKLLNSQPGNSNMFDFEQTFEIDQNYLEQVNLNKLSSSKEDLQEKCLNAGYQDVKIYINGDIRNNQMKIESVYVDLSDLVILQNAEHNDIEKIKKHITTIIANHLTITREQVYYEY